jgi:hypothetical protein
VRRPWTELDRQHPCPRSSSPVGSMSVLPRCPGTLVVLRLRFDCMSWSVPGGSQCAAASSAATTSATAPTAGVGAGVREPFAAGARRRSWSSASDALDLSTRESKLLLRRCSAELLLPLLHDGSLRTQLGLATFERHRTEIQLSPALRSPSSSIVTAWSAPPIVGSTRCPPAFFIRIWEDAECSRIHESIGESAHRRLNQWTIPPVVRVDAPRWSRRGAFGTSGGPAPSGAHTTSVLRHRSDDATPPGPPG